MKILGGTFTGAQVLAFFIMCVATLVTAFVVVASFLMRQSVPAWAYTIGGMLVGYAANAFGVHQGVQAVGGTNL